MKVKATTKHNYGTPHIYILNQDIKHAVNRLTGKLTINSSDIEALKVLGVKVEVNGDVLTV